MRGVVGHGEPGRGPEDADLSLEAVDRAPDDGQAEDLGRVGDEVAGREVVGAVEHDVVAAQHVERVVRVEPQRVLDDVDVRVDVRDALARGVDLAAPDVRPAVDDLALEVGRVDGVVVDDADRADARGGEVEQRGAAEAARADDEHARGREPPLALGADARQREVARVALELRRRELVTGRDEGRERRRHAAYCSSSATSFASASACTFFSRMNDMTGTTPANTIVARRPQPQRILVHRSSTVTRYTT